MKKRKAVRTAPRKNYIAKVQKTNDEEKHNGKDYRTTLEYFRNNTGTSLDCAFETQILRNSITYYIKHLENVGLLKAMYKAPDKRTGHPSKYYSANPVVWNSYKKIEDNGK